MTSQEPRLNIVKRWRRWYLLGVRQYTWRLFFYWMVIWEKIGVIKNYVQEKDLCLILCKKAYKHHELWLWNVINSNLRKALLESLFSRTFDVERYEHTDFSFTNFDFLLIVLLALHFKVTLILIFKIFFSMPNSQ